MGQIYFGVDDSDNYAHEIVLNAELENDFLSRSNFLAALQRHVDDIAAIPLDHLPAPRVLAVDAPWGSGKTWIAQRFKDQLSKDFEGRPVAFIDAFRYDHHDDVFAVIAAAVSAALKPTGTKKKRFLQATAQLMVIAAPVVAKVAVNAVAGHLSLEPGAIADAVESSKKAIGDNAGNFTEKSLQKLFDGYAKTQQLQEEFEGSLSAMTASLEKPFVVIIDELDRCRPSFALEVLERIKHLFSADNVVFVLFWNSESIHESIRHTYGRNTQAESYLAKFVSLTIPLTLPGTTTRHGNSTIDRFIEMEFLRVVPESTDQSIVFILSALATALKASLRDVQRAIAVYRSVRSKTTNWPVDEFAYLVLQSVMNRSLADGVIAGNREALAAAIAQLPVPDIDSPNEPLTHLWAALTYRRDSDKFDELGTTLDGLPDSEYDALVLSNIVRHSHRVPPSRWMDDAKAAIDSSLMAG